MKTKLKIVIAQTYINFLTGIENAINGNPELQVHYTTEPADALKHIIENQDDVLVTGQCFYGNFVKTPSDVMPDMEAALLGKPGALEKWRQLNDNLYRGLDDGNVLAERARQANPELITLRYSAAPDSIGCFCADVEKEFPPKNLASLLTNPNFLLSLSQKDKALLPSLTGVAWYLQNFPASWS